MSIYSWIFNEQYVDFKNGCQRWIPRPRKHTGTAVTRGNLFRNTMNLECVLYKMKYLKNGLIFLHSVKSTWSVYDSTMTSCKNKKLLTSWPGSWPVFPGWRALISTIIIMLNTLISQSLSKWSSFVTKSSIVCEFKRGERSHMTKMLKF